VIAGDREEIVMDRTIGSTIWILAALSLLSACEAPGVGDPCVPGEIPDDGFDGAEAYVQPRSAECRTGVCLVYQLSGIPFGAPGCETLDDVAANPACASRDETDARVYCTCRCDAPPGTTTSLCDCPGGDGPDDPAGFSCVEVVDAPGAGAGVAGDYCVRNSEFLPSI